MIKKTVKDVNFVEIFIDTPIEECEKRDVKGLYAKARKGLIKDFTGVNAPYEAPDNATITIDTTKVSVSESVEIIMKAIKPKLEL